MSRTPMHLRSGRVADLDAIVALDRETEFAPHWPVSAYRAILELPDSPRCLFVAEYVAADERLAGFGVGLIHPALGEASGTRTAELEDVVVAASARRAGIGHALCAAVIEWCRLRGASEIILEVRAASTGAIALYAGVGFIEIGRRPRYYSDPDDDAVAMGLRLEEIGSNSSPDGRIEGLSSNSTNEV